MSKANVEFKKVINEALRTEENVIFAERVFMANAIYKKALETTKDEKILFHYIENIKKYLNKEFDIEWEDGRPIIKKY